MQRGFADRPPSRAVAAAVLVASVLAVVPLPAAAAASSVQQRWLRLRRDAPGAAGNHTAARATAVEVAAHPAGAPRVALLARGQQPSALGAAFFRNPVLAGQYGAGGSAVGGARQASCHPKCWWTCGDADCDEVCDPVCAPPQCETACSPVNAATCRQQCDPPKCAIVCPSMHCEHGDCPQCKTVCNPPKCETICAEQCESRCAEPQCSWKCTPGKCEKPRCSLTCGGAKMCNFDKDGNVRPEFKPGMHTVAAGLAAFDPSTLGIAEAPALPPASPAPSAMAPVPTGGPMAR